MKYWIFQSNQVLGPYGPEDLCGLGTFSAESLVCPEGRRGTSMGDWQRAGMVPDLSAALVKSAQSSKVQTPVLTLAGLPAEPTLKDLAVLGSLQEKTAMLEDAVLQLQESLRVKDAELSGLHQELAEKDKEAFDLKRSVEERRSEVQAIKTESATLKNEGEENRTRADALAAESEAMKTEAARLKAESEELKGRIAEMEERVGEVRRIGDALDKAVEAEKKVEHDVDAHGATLGDLARQIETLRDQLQAKLGTPSHLMPSVGADAPAPPSPFAPALPAPPSGPAAVVPISAANVHPAAAPAAEFPNIAPPPAAAPPTPAPAPASAPGFASSGESVPFGAAPGVAPLPAFGSTPAPAPESAPAASAPSFDPLAPLPAASSAAEPPPIQDFGPAKPAAPASRQKPLLVVAGLAALLLVAYVELFGRRQRVVPPLLAAPTAPAVPPAPAGMKSAAPPPAPSADAGPAEGGPVEGGPVEGAPVADPRQAAIDAARSWKLADGRTLGDALETLSPPSGNLSPWMAEPQSSGAVLVNYFAHGAPGGPTVAYEFEVDSPGNTVAARNAAAKAVLTGRAVEPPAPPKRPVHTRVRPKAKAKPKPKPKRAAAKPVESLDNLLGAPGAAAPQAPATATPPAPPASKPAAKPAAAAPAQNQESLDDLLKN